MGTPLPFCIYPTWIWVLKLIPIVDPINFRWVKTQPIISGFGQLLMLTSLLTSISCLDHHGGTRILGYQKKKLFHSFIVPLYKSQDPQLIFFCVLLKENDSYACFKLLYFYILSFTWSQLRMNFALIRVWFIASYL